MDSILRRLFLYLSSAGWARGIVTRWKVARSMAMRFVAGENVTDALTTAKALNSKGLLVTLDYLGESVTSEADTQAVVQTYRDLLAGITTQDAQASISLKLTHLGLDISEELCITNLRHLLGDAKARGILVTIDMESSDYTDRTLRIYRTLRDEYEFENVGTVIQAYLYRSKQDMEALAAEGAHIRLCKGAYLEPAAVAFPEKADVDNQYVQLMTDFLQAPAPAYLCIATHDEKMIMAAEKLIDKKSSISSRCEFQMLYGIRTSRQEQLVEEGYPVRIYLPFGEAWYPYFMRRLAERPANVWFFLKSFTRK